MFHLLNAERKGGDNRNFPKRLSWLILISEERNQVQIRKQTNKISRAQIANHRQKHTGNGAKSAAGKVESSQPTDGILEECKRGERSGGRRDQRGAEKNAKKKKILI